MPVFELDDDQLFFPPAEFAEPSGLLAYGAKLTKERVKEAYRMGIFPWYNQDEPPLWWSPDPRCVLFPERVKVSKSMKQILRSGKFAVSFNKAFRQVIQNCREVHTKHGGTWISRDFVSVYSDLHDEGFCHSVEVWQDGVLVGGLYGAGFGKAFFGESMFSKVSNSSKIALIYLARNLERLGFELIDCQIDNPHLLRMGAEMIPRREFLKVVRRNRDLFYQSGEWQSLMHSSLSF